MDQSINQNRPQAGYVAATAKPQVIIQKSKEGWLVAAVLGGLLIISLIAGGVMYLKASYDSSLSGVDKTKYQALFLTNGQVYFGKLSQTDSKTVALKDIYYLQVQQDVQPKPEEATAQNQKLSLAKLGRELHGPEDAMYVDRSQVLFWENLKNKGKVVEAIKDYKNKQ